MKLTERQERVLATLERYGCQEPGMVAARAFIRTSSPRETASRHCINLGKLGLVEKKGTRKYPEWQITEAGLAILSDLKAERAKP